MTFTHIDLITWTRIFRSFWVFRLFFVQTFFIILLTLSCKNRFSQKILIITHCCCLLSSRYLIFFEFHCINLSQFHCINLSSFLCIYANWLTQIFTSFNSFNSNLLVHFLFKLILFFQFVQMFHFTFIACNCLSQILSIVLGIHM